MRKAILNSVLMHMALILGLIFFSSKNEAARSSIPLSANLVYSDKKLKKEHLPKKPKLKNKKIERKKLEIKKDEAKKTLRQKKDAEPVINHQDILKELAASFVKDGEEDEVVENYGEEAKNYFDQMYILLKNSFVLPPHINTLKGEELRSELRLLIDGQGNLSALFLEKSSGDEHFDKAVMDGARRVNNFGLPPKELLSLLMSTGILVELCPFVCKEQ